MPLKNPVTQPGIDPGTVRLVANRLNHYATPDPTIVSHYKGNYPLKVFDNRVLKQILGPKKRQKQEDHGNCVTRSFATYIYFQML
jgi:hypothetical protein